MTRRFGKGGWMAGVAFEGATKTYADGLDLGIEGNEFMVLVGPSGCGKTAALRVVGARANAAR